jgi:hypothetical protein
VLIAAFLVLNVLIGIVLNSMEEAREIERRRALGADVDDEISPTGRRANRHAARGVERARGRAQAACSR